MPSTSENEGDHEYKPTWKVNITTLEDLEKDLNNFVRGNYRIMNTWKFEDEFVIVAVKLKKLAQQTILFNKMVSGKPIGRGSVDSILPRQYDAAEQKDRKNRSWIVKTVPIEDLQDALNDLFEAGYKISDRFMLHGKQKPPSATIVGRQLESHADQINQHRAHFEGNKHGQ